MQKESQEKNSFLNELYKVRMIAQGQRFHIYIFKRHHCSHGLFIGGKQTEKQMSWKKMITKEKKSKVFHLPSDNNQERPINLAHLAPMKGCVVLFGGGAKDHNRQWDHGADQCKLSDVRC